MSRICLLTAAMFAVAMSVFTAHGQYRIEQSVIANGGGSSSSGSFRVEGTIGQSAAGEQTANGSLDQVGGFWQPLPLAPTAAPASVSGRVMTASGAGVRGIAVQIVDRSTGEIRLTLTNSFGFYMFNDLGVGDFYQVSVASKKYQFEKAVKSFSLTADMTDVSFIAVR